MFFSDTGPFYSFKKDDNFSKRFAQGILVSLGLASVTEISKALDVNRTTVLRNFNIFKEKGPEGFIDNRSNRSLYKLTKEKQQTVKRFLDEGATLAVAANEVRVSDGCVRKAIKNGLIVRKITNPSLAKDRIELKGSAKRSQEDTNCNAGIATKREEERLLALKGDLTEALPEFSPNEGVHYAGVLLALPFLAGLSYLDTGKKVYAP